MNADQHRRFATRPTGKMLLAKSYQEETMNTRTRKYLSEPEAADSIFQYIERTAEPVPDGIRWQTLNYENQPQYATNVFNGVAGISFFLSDYYRLTGNTRARDLALGALQWCAAQNISEAGLCTGKAGIGMAWLHFSQSTNDPGALKEASAIAEELMKLPPGPLTDILGGQAGGGAAGIGVFLVRLWEETGDERHLAAAVQCGEWLDAEKIQDERGIYWEVRTDQPSGVYLGFAHGISGVAYFLLLLYEATGDSRWADLARAVADTLSSRARLDRGGLNWSPLLNFEEVGVCQWCHGAPGVGLFYIKAFELFKELAYIRKAQGAGEATYQYRDVRGNPSQCHGLAGNAELLLELYRVTLNPIWLERARDFFLDIFEYRKTTPEGDLWQADEPGYYSPDFLCGASGTGHFFLRLWQPGKLRMPLL
jgi:lantibiotic modifying enzyme